MRAVSHTHLNTLHSTSNGLVTMEAKGTIDGAEVYSHFTGSVR